MMNCKDIQAVIVDYLDGAVDAGVSAAIDDHLAGCDACGREVREMRELMQAMGGELQQPGPGLRENFQTMLQSELNMLATGKLLGNTGGEEGKERKPGGGRVRLINPVALPWMAAAAFILVFGGIWIGAMLGSRKSANVPEQLSAMQKEMKEMKEAMLYSLIDNESASQRIKAVSYADEIANPDQKVIQVLVSTLNHDKNVNVRLAALYSLATFADSRSVRDSLVASLPKQTEPLIQVMLINLLAEKKDNRAIVPIRDIISNKNTLPAVKDAAEKSLKTL
jgi:hypothetical protein